jgi:hypothetical protein
MANDRGKAIDNTHLSIDQAEERGFIHRDYIAHCLRWTHVAKHLQKVYKTARVLDIGCGVDMPLARLLYSSRLIVEEYVGVDYNNPGKFKMDMFHTGKMSVHAYGNIDAGKHLVIDGEFLNVAGLAAHNLPNVISCFEVLEHVEPGHCRQISSVILDILRLTNGRAFLSTPCWDPQVGAAANHVSEITYAAFGAMLEDLGFAIVGKWGTFASQKDYKRQFIAEYGEPIWDKLSTFYDSNYLATVFAPLYPEHSRNCLWEITPAKDSYVRQFPPLMDTPGPWTSSEKWEELNG